MAKVKNYGPKFQAQKAEFANRWTPKRLLAPWNYHLPAQIKPSRGRELGRIILKSIVRVLCVSRPSSRVRHLPRQSQVLLRWVRSRTCPRRLSKPNVPVPPNALPDQKSTRHPQKPSQVRALYPGPCPSHPKQGGLCNQPIRCFLFFSSLFFVLSPIKASCLQAHFAILQLETVCSMKC